jgi:hypothetical protein
MSAAQVRRLLPLARAPEKPDPSLIGGLDETLDLKDVLANRSALTRFYFNNDRLVLVSVKVSGDDLDDRYLNTVIKMMNMESGVNGNCRHTRLSDSCYWPTNELTVTLDGQVNASKLGYSGDYITIGRMPTGLWCWIIGIKPPPVCSKR